MRKCLCGKNSKKVNNGSDTIETESKQHTDNTIKTLGSTLLPWLHVSHQLRVMAGIWNIWNINMASHSRGPGVLYCFCFFESPN